MTAQEAARLWAAAKAIGQQDRVLGQFADLVVAHLLKLDPEPVEEAPVVSVDAPQSEGGN